MKKFLFIIIALLCLNVYAQALKGGVNYDYIPKGFFGSWGVISKLNSTNNPILFNKESRDIWTLTGYGNKLILQNTQSGAISEILIQDRSLDNKTLKFTRKKVVKENNGKTVYTEIVSFVLSGRNFSGTDDFIVEKYENNKLISKNSANYRVAGVKIK